LRNNPEKIDKSEVPKRPVDVLDIGSSLADGFVQLNQLVKDTTGTPLIPETPAT
tara:strand:- start:208 stop:369 length:162 start_codon:yes stop_codon:yes gene_type:complete